MRKPRRLVLLCATILVGAGFGWLAQNATHPLWGGAQSETLGETFLAQHARAGEWKLATPAQNARWKRLTRENAPGWYATFAEPVQTFGAYQRQKPMRPTATRRVLVLQPLGTFSRDERRQLEALREFCATFFALPTRLEKPLALEPLDVATRTGAKGMQWDADAILGVLKPKLPADAVAYLAVTNRDLWSGKLNFVFGLASIRDRVGVYSLARYGARGEEARARELRRACQVLAHETGHMFGITHCVFYRCAMNGSNSLADADGAPLDFCPACERKLKWNPGYKSTERTAALDAFYRRHFAPDWVESLN